MADRVDADLLVSKLNSIGWQVEADAVRSLRDERDARDKIIETVRTNLPHDCLTEGIGNQERCRMCTFLKAWDALSAPSPEGRQGDAT